MTTVVEIEPTLVALAATLGITHPKPSKRIEVKPYCYDSRIDWDTYIVTVDHQAVGFTDGPVK